MCRQCLSASCMDGDEEQKNKQEEKEKEKEREKESLFVSVFVEKDRFLDANDREHQFYQTATQIAEELKSLWAISGPMVLTGLLQYSRAIISMLFLGRLGETELAGGSLALGFANITGYSVISGLALGMEPICGQAYGAKRWGLLGLSLQRMVLILLASSLPTLVLWLNMERILLLCRQDEEVTRMAKRYILFSVPDLFAQALLHPIRIYLRSQNVTSPLACTAAIAVAMHVPINFMLVDFLDMGIAGVALAASWTSMNQIISLLIYFSLSGVHKKTWPGGGLSAECLSGWTPLLKLALPSCISVCLEWWWYEFMIILCGLLINPRATVASMGILIQTTSLLYIFPSSLGVGVSIRVSNELGANRPSRARRASVVAIICSCMLGFMAVVFAYLVRHRWARLFTSDSEILKLTSMALPVLGLCELGNCPQTAGCGVLRGSARPSLGANINLGSFYLVGMPVALTAGFFLRFGFVGLWIGLLAAQASCLGLMLFHLFRTDWGLQATRAVELAESQDPKICEDLEPLVAAL